MTILTELDSNVSISLQRHLQGKLHTGWITLGSTIELILLSAQHSKLLLDSMAVKGTQTYSKNHFLSSGDPEMDVFTKTKNLFCAIAIFYGDTTISI